MKTAKSMAVSWALALLLTSIAVWAVGESPLNVLKILGVSAFGSIDNITYTLYFATPMLLTGAAVALALEAGLFNIGAEGQLYVGAVCAASWGAFSRHWLPGVTGFSFGGAAVVLVGALVAFGGGALWGAIAGYLRTKRNVHEVISTIMLNFIGMALVNWAVLNPLKNQDTQILETVSIGNAFRVPHLWHQTTYGLPLALVIVVAVLWSVKKTWWGFRVRATGQNENAARTAGIPVGRTAFVTMALSGGIAGLVGFHTVFLDSYRMVDGFSAGFGFTGLAVALLARGSIPGLIFSAILFGGLHKGTLDLDLETEKVTRDLSAVIQALILVALAAQPKIAQVIEKLAFKRKGAA